MPPLPQLAAYKASHLGLGTPVARIARTLALAPDSGPLPSEIRAIDGYIGDTPAVLADYSPFTRIDRWHWTLGTPG